MIIGYARTSTADQKAGLDFQIDELTRYGCSNIFSETVSSVDAKRPELNAALSFLRSGDEFVCTRPDRLARSTRDLAAITGELAERGVRVVILSMNIDTGSPTGQLLMTMMGAVAEFERNIMLERQRAGITRAKAEGKYKGRHPTARKKEPEIARLSQAGLSCSEIMSALGISRASYYRLRPRPTTPCIHHTHSRCLGR